jgi:lysyl oxidase
MTRAVLRLLPLLGATALAVLVLIAGVGSTTPTQATGSRSADRTQRLPDLDQETPAQLEVTVVGSGTGRSYRLGCRSAVRNIGDGPLIVNGTRPDRRTPFMTVDQLIERRDGGPPVVVPDVGVMKYVVSPDHRHWHYLQFDRYELQSYELRRVQTNEAVVKDGKTGFCLGDRYRVPKHALPAAAHRPEFTGRCGLEDPNRLRMREGISVGWGDDYAAFLEGQDLPLGGLPDGRYLLVHRVNADRGLRELDHTNDAASLLLSLRWRSGVPHLSVLATCPDSASCGA